MKNLLSSVAVLACLSGCASGDKPAESADATAETSASCGCGETCTCDACASGKHDSCTCKK